MIRYSHVSLLILCDELGAAKITSFLGCNPSRIDHDPSEEPPPTGLTHTWRLDSPLKHTEGNPTQRLTALVDQLEPFGQKLAELDTSFSPFIDIVYHVTPQRKEGITGEFDWFQLPAGLIRRIATFNVDLSYESFWFDHPEWQITRLPWWRRFSLQAQQGAAANP